MALQEELSNLYECVEPGLYASESSGYWSNLSEDENSELLSVLNECSASEALRRCHPKLEEVIYSPKRAGGLELLQLRGDESCIDYGCMWGALTIPLAKRCKYILGIDQTADSLRFLRARVREERLENVGLLCADMKRMPLFGAKADVAIVNGVLEWIPEEGPIDLQLYYGKYHSKSYAGKPIDKQRKFLRRVVENLKRDGKVYVAIENRYDFKMFMGIRDPHSKLMFTSVLPRGLADIVSQVNLGRPYVNWIYSFRALEKLLEEVGLAKVDLYMCFPDYRFPDQIIPYEKGLEGFRPTITLRNSTGRRSVKRLLGRAVEEMVFKTFKLQSLAPSIIAVGHK